MITNNGVKYIKVNRKDIDGDNHTFSLEELNTLKIRYNDIGVITYQIVQRSEYPEYYLYQVAPMTVTSSVNNYVLDYYCVARSSSIYTLSALLPSGSEYKVSFPILVDDIQGNFHPGTSLTEMLTSSYQFQNTPNIPLTIQFSTTASGYTSPPEFYMFYYTNGNFGGIIDTVTANGSGYAELEYTGNFITNDIIY